MFCRRNQICLLLSCLLAASSASFSQDTDYKEPSRKSQAYHESRLYVATPPYGLEKVRKLMKKMVDVPDKDESDMGTLSLSSKAYASLTIREKFTYTMIHGESYSQACDVFLAEDGEENRIYKRLPDFFAEESWSDRQVKFLKDNRDSVMTLIRESVTRSKKFGLNYKAAILEINGVEMIPFLVGYFNQQKKDGDILTLMNLLMKENKYPPFMNSATYQKLYSSENIYQGYIEFNKANEELIIKRALEFYQTRANKK